MPATAAGYFSISSVAVAEIVGNSSARWIWYCARAAMTLSAATLASGLCASAVAINSWSRASVKKSRHPRSAAGVAAAVAAAAAAPGS